MAEYTTINDFTVWSDDYDDFKGKYELTGTFCRRNVYEICTFLKRK